MSDFENLCNTFDTMGLKYGINEYTDKRQIVIEENEKVEQIGLSDPIIWFDFDQAGNFRKLCVEE